jgi:phage repressor protein C with HTH and peptisase S24 domain
MLSKRLKIAMDEAGMSQAQLARACGVKPPSVNGWLSGKSKFLRGENLLMAARALGVSEDWLATGKGPMKIEFDDLERPRSMTFSLSQSQDFHPTQSSAHSNRLAIPVLAAAASMGNGNALSYDGDQIIDVLPVSRTWLETNVKAKPQNLRVITGAGDSMHPTFSDGDMLLVDISKAKIDIDGVYVLSAHERLFIKRVRQRMDGSFEVSSDNPTVKTVDILNGDHQIQVHGRVVWAWNGRAL